MDFDVKEIKVNTHFNKKRKNTFEHNAMVRGKEQRTGRDYESKYKKFYNDDEEDKIFN